MGCLERIISEMHDGYSPFGRKCVNRRLESVDLWIAGLQIGYCFLLHCQEMLTLRESNKDEFVDCLERMASVRIVAVWTKTCEQQAGKC